MGWNEPPDGNNGKNPWGNNGGKKNDGDGPPDLDEIVRKMQQGLGGIFGNKSSSGAGAGGGAALPQHLLLSRSLPGLHSILSTR